MPADASLLFALGIPVLLRFLFAGAALLMCRWDQRHDRDVELDVPFLHYRSSRRPHEHSAPANPPEQTNVHSIAGARRQPTTEEDTAASRAVPRSGQLTSRRAA
jgi:hypothetical protein